MIKTKKKKKKTSAGVGAVSPMSSLRLLTTSTHPSLHQHTQLLTPHSQPPAAQATMLMRACLPYLTGKTPPRSEARMGGSEVIRGCRGGERGEGGALTQRIR